MALKVSFLGLLFGGKNLKAALGESVDSSISESLTKQP